MAQWRRAHTRALAHTRPHAERGHARVYTGADTCTTCTRILRDGAHRCACTCAIGPVLTNSLITSPCLVIDAPVPANYQQQSIMAPESANTIVLLRPGPSSAPFPFLSSPLRSSLRSFVHATRQSRAPPRFLPPGFNRQPSISSAERLLFQDATSAPLRSARALTDEREPRMPPDRG